MNTEPKLDQSTTPETAGASSGSVGKHEHTHAPMLATAGDHASPAGDGANDPTQVIDAAPDTATHTTDDVGTTEALPAAHITEGSRQATRRMPNAADAGASAPADPTLNDVARTVGDYLRSHAGATSARLGRRPMLVALVAAVAVIAILAGVLAGMRAADLPGIETVESDARTQVTTPAYVPGVFGDDSPLTAHGVTVIERSHTGEGTASATAHVTWVNDGVVATAEVRLEYRRGEDGWTFAGASMPHASFVARHGVESSTLVGDHAALDAVLAKAEATWQADAAGNAGTDAGGTSLTLLYQDASANVYDGTFDEQAQTDTKTIHVQAEGTFTALNANITATFAFRPATGTWELTEAVADKTAKDLLYTPLVGTWNTTHADASSTGAACYGASDVSTLITIDDANDKRVTGTITTLAHYHDELSERTNGSEGDTTVTAAFTAGRVDDASGISYAGSVLENAQGNVELRLDFGLADAPDAVRARVTTTYLSDATFLLIPYTRTSTFTDTYTMTRS